MQVPGTAELTVAPKTEQMLGVRLLKATARPELAVALSVALPGAYKVGAGPKVMV